MGLTVGLAVGLADSWPRPARDGLGVVLGVALAVDVLGIEQSAFLQPALAALDEHAGLAGRVGAADGGRELGQL